MSYAYNKIKKKRKLIKQLGAKQGFAGKIVNAKIFEGAREIKEFFSKVKAK